MSRQSVSSIERGVVQLTGDTFSALLVIITVNDEDLFNNLTADKEFEGVIEELKERINYGTADS